MKTNWKKGIDPNYIGSHELDNGDSTYRNAIATITKAVIETTKTQESKTAVVLYFKEFKPLIVNATNGKAMKAMYGRYIEDWVGKKIELYVLKGVKAYGEVTDAIRIKAKQPTLPTMDENSAVFAKALARIKEGTATIEQVEQTYTLTENAKKLLTDAKV
jgi:hypothetical protein